MDRFGDWIQTFTGRKFWPADPRANEMDIKDIAHSLSMQCRFTGHCIKFYSVAEHCVLLSEKVPSHYALWALLHDAAEAYLTDVPRPIKPLLPQYKIFEEELMRVVCVAFGLHPVEPDDVRAADYAILSDEMVQNMVSPPEKWATHGEGLGVKLQFWSPERAEVEFLSTYERVRWLLA